MVYVFLLLAVSSSLAFCCNHYRRSGYEGSCCYGLLGNNATSLVFFHVLFLLLVVFSGTRTLGNDTPGYIASYLYDIDDWLSLKDFLAMDLGANPGFHLLQTLIKGVYHEKYIYFLTISALIVNFSILAFFYKYSKSFVLAVFLYVASTHYAFTLAAQKQVLAISLGIWLLPLALKRRWLFFVVLLAVAMTFHPYIVMLSAIPFLLESVWGKKSFLILLGVVVFLHGLHFFIPVVVDATALIGDYYDVLNEFQEGVGVNVFRILVFSVTPILSYMYRKEINRENDGMLIGCCNMSLMAFACMLVSSILDPNLFGRLAAYFEVFTYTALSTILVTFPPLKYKQLLIFGCIVGYCIFYYVFYTKYGDCWFLDIYRHQSIWNYF